MTRLRDIQARLWASWRYTWQGYCDAFARIRIALARTIKGDDA